MEIDKFPFMPELAPRNHRQLGGIAYTKSAASSKPSVVYVCSRVENLKATAEVHASVGLLVLSCRRL